MEDPPALAEATATTVGTPELEEAAVTMRAPAADKPTTSGATTEMAGGALDAQLEEMMGDAPVYDVCGHITVRNGSCYRCLNCGNSMGCS